MPSSYPGALDVLTNPTANDTLAAVPHHTQHGTVNDIAEALEAKVGIGSSTPTAGSFLVGTATGTSKWQGSYWNVKMSGAVGDGNTDDTAAFRACALLGGRIHVPVGTYIVDWVDLALDIEWYGDGATSTIRKKPNSVGTTYTVDHISYLFNVTDADVTVGFTDLVLDGNYDGQVTTAAGATPGNTGGAINNYNANATVLAVGGAITTIHAHPASSSERLIVRVTRCTLRRAASHAIYMASDIDVGAYAELLVEGCLFTDFGPGISEYHDGVSTYDGIAGLPLQGYSFSTNGQAPTGILMVDGVHAIIRGNTFLGVRDPVAGTITTDTGFNCYNLPALGVFISALDDVNDPTPEWSAVLVEGNRFKGLGRTITEGNGLGVVEFYTRLGNATISGNSFTACYEAPIRGKTNSKNLTIVGNTIEGMLHGGGGISITPETSPAQRGDYVISGNVIKGASLGIQVVGDPVPDENSIGAIADDPDSRVNNIVIAGNVVEDITNIERDNPVQQAAYASYGFGIHVRYASDVTITGNIVKTTTSSTGSNGTEHGIWVRDCLEGLTIADNNVSGITQNGIFVGTHVGVVDVSGNQVRDTAGFGIYVENTGESTTSRNTVDSTGLSGIVAGSADSAVVRALDNVVSSVSGSSASNLYGIDSSSVTAGTIEISRNVIDGVANAGAGGAYGIRAQFATIASTNLASIHSNRVSGTDESGVLLYRVTGSLVGNAFTGCNTAGGTAHGAILINSTANAGLLRVADNSVDNGTAPFPTTGGAAGSTMRAARLINESGNSWQPVQTVGSAAPVSGTWAVGDIVWDTAPTSGGTIGWVCTTAGAPGTWKAFGSIA